MRRQVSADDDPPFRALVVQTTADHERAADHQRRRHTEWLLGELTDVENRIAEPGFADDTDPDEAADPHRLLDYSLEAVLSRPPYSAADLELNWVEDQSDSPYSYGLIDAEGRWRIPMGRRYVEVRPFRDGVAEVRLPAGDGSYGGPWVRIDTGGETVGP
ncbi:WG repeat-containing protein [Streptomyces sp. TRM68416]|uniref:WG repeat-containing protein n=1 Tax=Streptomyces sp. TRM68416 TaxID=2758412 RepID=UPI001661A142|nr:WG repeat-containing protein [Streptomyces sp. TRM68416]MBD0841507.1 WG repeat-containing protein [Streptomyces sp. TRM68416]